MSKYIEPKNGYIILKPIEEQEVLAGNIILPDLGKERPEIATVESVSVGYNFYTGTQLPSTLKEGGADFLSGSPLICVNKTLLKGFFLVPSLNSDFRTVSKVTGLT